MKGISIQSALLTCNHVVSCHHLLFVVSGYFSQESVSLPSVCAHEYIFHCLWGPHHGSLSIFSLIIPHPSFPFHMSLLSVMNECDVISETSRLPFPEGLLDLRYFWSTYCTRPSHSGMGCLDLLMPPQFLLPRSIIAKLKLIFLSSGSKGVSASEYKYKRCYISSMLHYISLYVSIHLLYCTWKGRRRLFNWVATFLHLHLVFVDKASGVVKVLNCEIEQIVLDGFAGSIVDVSFANSQDVVLAAADQTGDLRVFRISILPSGRLMYPFH